MSKLILVTVFIFFSSNAFGDFLLHGNQSYKFESNVQIDSIKVIESDHSDFSEMDTVSFNPGYVVHCRNNNCRAGGHDNKKYQQLIIYINGVVHRSDVYEPIGSNPTFLVKESEIGFTVIETTSFLFKGRLGEILRALLITLLLELMVALLFFKLRDNLRVFTAIILINLFTIPLAWLTFPLALDVLDSEIFLTLVYEIIILILEYLGLRFFIRTYTNARILGFVIAANLASFIIGGILYFVSRYM